MQTKSATDKARFRLQAKETKSFLGLFWTCDIDAQLHSINQLLLLLKFVGKQADCCTQAESQWLQATHAMTGETTSSMLQLLWEQQLPS